MPDTERSLAVFIDFENLALGFQGRRDRFDIAPVLERLVEKGKIVAKKAYADWSRFGNYTAPLHESAIELVEIPRRAQTSRPSLHSGRATRRVGINLPGAVQGAAAADGGAAELVADGVHRPVQGAVAFVDLVF